jgi:hypothetical protein
MKVLNIARRQVVDEATSPVTAIQPQLTPRQRLIEAIIAEAGARGVECDTLLAETFIGFCQRVRDELGSQTGYVDVVDEDLAMLHGLLTVIMPDGTRATEGTAHDQLNHFIFGGSTGKRRHRQLVHSSRHEREARYCTVEVSVVRARH